MQIPRHPVSRFKALPVGTIVDCMRAVLDHVQFHRTPRSNTRQQKSVSNVETDNATIAVPQCAQSGGEGPVIALRHCQLAVQVIGTVFPWTSFVSFFAKCRPEFPTVVEDEFANCASGGSSADGMT